MIEKRVYVSFMAGLLLVLGALTGGSSAQAAFSEYDIESVSASLTTLQAAGHPDLTTFTEFKQEAGPFGPEPLADTRDLAVELPQGFTANPTNFPTCPFVTFVSSADFTGSPPCPQDSQVGLVEVQLAGLSNPVFEPLYNLAVPEDKVARLGFIAAFVPIYLDVALRSATDYGVTVTAEGIQNQLPINSIRTKTWGVPADPIHNTERLTPFEAVICPGGEPCLVGGSRPSGLSPEPFLTNPSSCGPAILGFTATAYQLPGQTFSKSASAGDIEGCEDVAFEPTLSISPTSLRAGAPTGLEATLTMPQNEATNTLGTSPLKDAAVTLPEGMTVNSSGADGLGACSAEQVGYETTNQANCPDASKIGSAEITSPALKRPIQAGIFLRTPEPGHLVRFWLVSDELGVHLKLPAEVELDQNTGRLTTVIPESPELPAEKVVLRLNGGSRAALRNPKSCGEFNAEYRLEPWSESGPAVGASHFEIKENCNPSSFNPQLSAGTISPAAGSFSPFVFDVMGGDDDHNISVIDVTLPKGLVAKLAGVLQCPEEATSSGNCPDGSQIGVVRAAVGAGTTPLWIPQPGRDPTAAYLAGPYKGAPFSLVAKAPAQAGPFDLGVVTVRSGIFVDPETAEVTVKSDILPQILEGIPIQYRHVGVEVNRDRFTLNPTSCEEMEVSATITSIDGASADTSDRFQAADCASLGFSPNLRLTLKGGTRRTAHPSLQAILMTRPGQANIRRASVALPHSEFLDQAHIRTVCTRVQFAAGACPPGSIYGRASVTTPLLENALRGPVYLRSSSNELPDLVADLKGELRVTLVGRIDSANGGIRTTFESAPDAPFTKFVLNMKGGKKGLLVNSQDLCKGKHAATVRLQAHNGKLSRTRPVLRRRCR